MKKLLIIIAGVLTFTACSEDIAVVDSPGSLAGIVADSSTGEPVPTVRLELSPGGASTVTGSDGSFSFAALEKGEYTIKLSKKGYNDTSSKATVNSGLATEVHLLIERIPAVITIDREELDFGENESMNTLSFNMVNNNYVDLDYAIIENCGWIESVDPQKGTLPYGKTATVVVKIDRKALLAGLNETVIVVSTSDGSSELKIKATGIERSKPTLNTLEATDIKASSARIHGEMLTTGYPIYYERGFVYNDSPLPDTVNTKAIITAPITDDSKFSMAIEGLELGKTYYVRAFAKNEIGLAYSSNQVSFTTHTTLAKVTITDTSINSTTMTASFYGSVTEKGDPAFTECGFVYSDVNTVPTFADTKIALTADTYGNFETHNVGPFLYDTNYYVRAYATNAAGTAYSEVVTLSVKSELAEVSITEYGLNSDTMVAMLKADIDSKGIPAYTECGFVYSSENSVPTLFDTVVPSTADNYGHFEVRLTEGFTYDTKYYFRAYATNMLGTAYSDVVKLEIESSLPAVTTLDITDQDRTNHVGVLHAEITSAGVPTYSERGFVYSDIYESPTIYDNKFVVEGGGIGAYEYRVTELPSDRSYYVRAYVINDKGTAYGDVVKLFNYSIYEIPTAGIAVQDVDIGNGYWDDINNMCENSDYEGFTDWRLPTIDELYVLYNNKDKIGGFVSDGNYWSSTYRNSHGYHYVYFYNGTRYYKFGRDGKLYGRCVRTLSTANTPDTEE